MKIVRFLCLTAGLIGCSNIQKTTEKQPEPAGKAPENRETVQKPTDMGKKVTLWATFYYIPDIKSSKTGVYIRNRSSKIVGPKIPLEGLCDMMLQGSGYVDDILYSWDSYSSAYKADCSFYSSKISGTLKFDKHYKCPVGAKSNCLTPFKSIAVDRDIYPLGTKFFIPALKGINGHDGVVVAEDIGGGVKGNHIDFYIGRAVPRDKYKIAQKYKFVKSKPHLTFEAYIID